MSKARVLTLIEKVNIIRHYLRTKKTHDLARMFNCHRGQIHHILKHKDEYLADWLATGDPTRTRRPRCKVLNALGIILIEWLVRCREYDVLLSDELVKQKATEIAQLLKYRLFRPNPKWYSRFRIKYKLDRVASWAEWMRLGNEGEKQASLDLEDIINDLRQIHGEGTIPNYVQVDDDEFKDLTVRCYGNRNIAVQLGELLTAAGEERDVVDVVQVVDEDADYMGESSNSHGGYVAYNGNDDEAEDNYDTISIESDNDNSAYVDDAGGGGGGGDGNGNLYNSSSDEKTTDSAARAIGSYREALNALGPLEQFALLKEDVRAVGLINQLEIIFRDRMTKELGSQ